jgi:hypothetical protein
MKYIIKQCNKRLINYNNNTYKIDNKHEISIKVISINILFKLNKSEATIYI